MDAEGRFSGAWSNSRKAPDSRAPSPSIGEHSNIDKRENAAEVAHDVSGRFTDPGQDKFGVEEHALFDFRDYGLD